MSGLKGVYSPVVAEIMAELSVFEAAERSMLVAEIMAQLSVLEAAELSNDKFDVLEEVRAITGLGLQGTEDLAEDPPKVKFFRGRYQKVFFRRIQRKLIAADAIVEVEGHPIDQLAARIAEELYLREDNEDERNVPAFLRREARATVHNESLGPSPEDWLEIKRQALELLAADQLDSPSSHLDYIRQRVSGASAANV